MLRLLDLYRDELMVTAPSGDIQRAAAATREHLQTSTARLEVLDVSRQGDDFLIEIEVSNLAGHKLPTAYPSRRAWIHLLVHADDGDVLFESGAMERDGSIAGNDNDADASAYEPHYELIDDPGQVQIYEPIILDGSGGITTGLLRAVSYAKDNRMLPTGFDKESAEDAVKVHGLALEDGDFQGGADRIRYRVTVPPETQGIEIRARLMFQTIGYRWARNLASYDSGETRRFAGYYDANADTSATILAETSRVSGQ